MTDTDRPFRGRRVSWAEFERVTGRKKPDYARLKAEAANDNDAPLHEDVTAEKAT
ncbi:hypothetical protein [Hoeflea alexandrii]|uniref:hypothetical protein n=1 Tax=Hoeflea alexandrii TaxID=288436 RepID=UPI0022AF6EF5|nr:hypothetical protein [Hoeflea alexandrii]MCZ4287867.1 hypothetical protein [Hoeflea alexandrii]